MNGGNITLRLSLNGAEQVRAELEKMGPAGSRAMRELDRSLRQPTTGLRALDAASGQVRNGLDDLASRGGAAGGVLMNLGPWGLAAAAGIGALATALVAATQFAIDASRAAAELVDTADRIGVTTEALQAWSYAADEAGVPVDTLHAGMERLNATVGRLKLGLGDGRIRPIFDQLGISQDDLDQVDTADEMLLLLADTLGEVQDRAVQVRMAEAMGIAELLPLLRLGSDGLRELTDEARDLGTVLDGDVVAQLDAADRQLELAGIQMRNTATLGVLPLATALGDLAEWWGVVLVRAQEFRAEAPALESWLLRLAAAAVPGGNLIRPAVEASLRRPGVESDKTLADIKRPAPAPTPTPDPDTGRPAGGGGGAASAEAEARRAEMRRRALEDLALELDLEAARAAANQDLIRQLEIQRSERQFSRRLEDLGVDQAEIAVRLEERRSREAANRAAMEARLTEEIDRQVTLEEARLSEAHGRVRALEREEELARRIREYNATFDLEEATRRAEADQAVIDDARDRAARRWLDQAAEAHELELARLSGARDLTRELERQTWLSERSEALQRDGQLAPRDADDQAQREWAEREAAIRRSLLREGITDFLQGVRDGDLEGFFEGLADRFATRLEDQLADQLLPLFEQLAQLLLDGLSGSGSGGWSGFVTQVVGSVLGTGASGLGAGGSGASGKAMPGGQGSSGALSSGALSSGTLFVQSLKGGPDGAPGLSALTDLALTRALAQAPVTTAARMEGAMAQPVSPPMKIDLHNHGGEALRAEASPSPDGGLRLDLYPQFKGYLAQAGRDGTLGRAAGLTPRPRRRG